MRVLIDESGYVSSYATLGCDDWEEVEDPEDFDEEQFASEYQAYKVIDGKLVKDPDKLKNILNEHELDELRFLRQRECFPFVNRGELWYSRLTDSEKAELNAWYDAWLDVTETLEIPEKPEWLE